MKSKTILIGVIVVLIGVVGYLAFRPAAGGGTKNVGSEEAQREIATGAQIIDVRTPGEFQLAHIPGAINVPLDELEGRAASWDKNATYVVYCQTGSRSATAVGIMEKLGFGSIVHLSQGLSVWSGDLEQGASSGGSTFDTAGKPLLVEFFTNT